MQFPSSQENVIMKIRLLPTMLAATLVIGFVADATAQTPAPTRTRPGQTITVNTPGGRKVKTTASCNVNTCVQKSIAAGWVKVRGMEAVRRTCEQRVATCH
jgi:hypothetical protein